MSNYFPLRYDLGPMTPIQWPTEQINGNSLLFYRENYLSPELCAEMINYMESSNALQPSVTRGKIDEVSRPNSFAMMGGKPAGPLFAEMMKFAREHFDAMNVFPEGTVRTDGVKLHKTIPGGYFNWHADEGISLANTPRQWTMLAYLNDNFEGGHTQFLLQQIDVTPKQGLILFYPSNMSHIHRGTEVTSGNKYLVTMWASEEYTPPPAGE